MLEMLVKNLVPPGGYNYITPQTGAKIEGGSFYELVNHVKKHLHANGLNVPDNLKEIIEEQICLRIPPEFCGHTPETVHQAFHCRVSANDIAAGAVKLFELVKRSITNQETSVSQSEAERRADICSRCYRNQTPEGCMACGAMRIIRNACAPIIGNKITSVDYMLKSCCACKCDIKTIVHINKEILDAGKTEEQVQRMPDFCWQR